jgi:hypothetical protein
LDAEIFKCEGKDIDFDAQNFEFDRLGVKKIMQNAAGDKNDRAK